MNFGEKLFKLRKERAMSQEALAEKLNTTRQAISKWENGQGFPETEKLLMLSNIFEVSVDYLLKDNDENNRPSNEGYYVSKEMADGYFLNERQSSKYIGLGFASWALMGIPHSILVEFTSWRILGMALFAILGIMFLVLGALKDSDTYSVLKTEPLIFDHDFLKNLSNQYKAKRPKLYTIIVASITLIAASVVAIFVSTKEWLPLAEYLSIAFLVLSFGLFALIQAINCIEMYELFLDNRRYNHRFSLRIKKRLEQFLNKI